MTSEPSSATKGERTRATLLAAAYQQFVTKGYHGASMRSIAEAAGITAGAIYNHYTGKEDIFRAVVLAYHPFSLALPPLANAEGETLSDFLNDAIQRFVQAFEDSPGILNLLFIELVECEGRHLPELASAFAPAVMAFAEKMQAAPDLSRTQQPFVIVRTFLSMLFAYYITEQFLTGARFPTEIGDVSDFLDIYLHGVLVRAEEQT